MCVSGLSVHHLCMCLQRPVESSGCPGAGGTGDCEAPCRVLLVSAQPSVQLVEFLIQLCARDIIGLQHTLVQILSLV